MAVRSVPAGEPAAKLEAALAAFRAGAPVVVLDDGAAATGGVLVLAADRATPAGVAFAVRHTSGVLCVAMPPARLDELDLPPMARTGDAGGAPAFTVSVDAVHGTTTGISAEERAITLRALCRAHAAPSDFARPGHVFPVRSDPDGLFGQPGPAEAALELAASAGLHPASAFAHLVDGDGELLGADDAAAFAARHGLRAVSVEELRADRARREPVVALVSSAPARSPAGVLTAHTFRSVLDGAEHVALVHGHPAETVEVLVRLQRECVVSDVFGSECRCGTNLQAALDAVSGADAGVLVYLRGRVPAADVALVTAGILRHVGADRIRLLVDDPGEWASLTRYGVDVRGEVPLEPALALVASS